MAQKIAVLSQKGGTGKTTAVRHLTDVFRRAGLSVLAVDLDPQGNLSDYFDVEPDVEPTMGDVLTGRASATAAVHDDIIPANLTLAEAELALVGQDGPRADAAQGAQAGRGRLRPRPHRLPAVAGAAHRQRARRRRLRAAERRGAVLRAAGRRAGARGHRAGPRQPQPRPRVARRGVQHRRHAHRPLARGLRVAARARRRQAAAARPSASRSPTPSRPSGRSRSSITAPTSARTTSRWPTSCSTAWASRPRGAGSSSSRLPRPS